VHILHFFLALFATLWCINREILTKKVEKVQKCEKCNANAKCDAKNVRCDAMSFKKKSRCKCDAKKFLHHRPCLELFLLFQILKNERVG
jgi:hypothetical protein